jgi:uncharacterized protein YceK
VRAGHIHHSATVGIVVGVLLLLSGAGALLYVSKYKQGGWKGQAAYSTVANAAHDSDWSADVET